MVVELFIIRLVLPSQVDDVNPLMECSEEVLDLGDVYFVVQTVLESCWQQLFFYQITKLNSYFMF